MKKKPKRDFKIGDWVSAAPLPSDTPPFDDVEGEVKDIWHGITLLSHPHGRHVLTRTVSKYPRPKDYKDLCTCKNKPGCFDD